MIVVEECLESVLLHQERLGAGLFYGRIKGNYLPRTVGKLPLMPIPTHAHLVCNFFCGQGDVERIINGTILSRALPHISIRCHQHCCGNWSGASHFARPSIMAVIWNLMVFVRRCPE